MPMHEDYMKDYGMDCGCGEYPMYPQMPGMGGAPTPYPMMGMPGMGGCMPMYPQMPMMGGMPPCPPMMGDYDPEELCCAEHMNEYMAYMCKAEACKMRAMQCMSKPRCK